jgi:hypothetical protein
MRVTPELLTYASFGGESTESSCADNGGMVLDISESGMAVTAALAMCEGVLVSITVPADATHPVIDLRGRVVRVTESKRRVGVRFEEVSANNRELLRRWIVAIGGLVSSATVEVLPTLPSSGTLSAADPDGPGGLDVEDLEDKVATASGMPEAVTMERLTAPAEVKEVTPPTSLKRPSLERPRLGPSVVRTFPAPLPKAGQAVQPPQRSRPTLPPTAAVRPAPALGVKSVAAGSGNRQANPLALGVAILLVVILCFGVGIAIGRSVLRWRANPLVSSANSSPTLEPALAAVTPETGQRTESVNAASASKVAPISNPTPTGGSGLTSRAAPDVGMAQTAAGSPAAAPRNGPASDIAPRGTATGQRVSANTEASLAAARRDGASEGPSALPAAGTSETIVTPNEGDSPLRVELSEEILVQTASLEIRSRRFALVPGAAPGRSHKLRKERLVMGRLISRVTPQPPTSALETGAGGKQIVTVRATIAADGHVSYVDPLSGPIALMPVVMSAVREWKYEPSSLDGDPFATEVDLVIQFGPAR